MALIVYAHPHPTRSRANRALLAAVRDLEGVEVRSLYDLYPDFDIDVAAEQAALLAHDLIVWQHPLYWYSVPGMLKHWFDKVLARGFAYGGGAQELAGKRCLWVSTSGGDEEAFSERGFHEHPFSAFVAPVAQTARFCKMHWLEPIAVHGAHSMSDGALTEHAERYRDRLVELTRERSEEDA